MSDGLSDFLRIYEGHQMPLEPMIDGSMGRIKYGPPIVPRREERWEVRAYIGSPMRESGTHSREFDHETAARDYEMELNSRPGTYCVGVYRLDSLDNKPVVPRRVTEHGRMMWAADLGLPSNNTPPFFWLGRDAEATNG